MSMFQLTEGAAVNFILPVFMTDANGDGVAGIGAAAVTAWYKREGAAAVSIPVVAAATEGVYQSGGWIACANVGAGNYELHVPNAAFVAGSRYVIIYVGASGAVAQRYVVEIGPYDIDVPNNFGLTAIDANGRVSANTVLIEGVDATDQIAANSSGATPAQIADAVWDEARAGHVAAGSFGEGVASVRGNVTGSVGSVAGNVGGNVAGTVGGVQSTVNANTVLIEGADATDVLAAINVPPTPAQVSAQVWLDKEPVDLNPDQSGVTVGAVANRVTANTDQLNGSADAAAKLALSAQKLIVGNATSVSATQMTAAIAVNGNLTGATVVFDNGARAKITSYSIVGGVAVIGYDTLTVVPLNNAAFAIV